MQIELNQDELDIIATSMRNQYRAVIDAANGMGRTYGYNDGRHLEALKAAQEYQDRIGQLAAKLSIIGM